MNQNMYSSEDIAVFCTEENIKSCLDCILQKFGSLGYPPVHSTSGVHSYIVNCDIVKFLNITNDLILNYKEGLQKQDDLNDRIHSLSSELSFLTKRYSQIKENTEQLDRKYRNSLEQERQAKEKVDQLLQSIKSEKDEVRKLSSHIQQQKSSHLREVRKLETDMNKIGVRLKQIQSEKNPGKIVASTSCSRPLKKDSRGRSRWQTGSVAKTATEEMFTSVLSRYELQCNELKEELSNLCQSLINIESKMLRVMLCFETVNTSENSSMSTIFIGPNVSQKLNTRFEYLFNELENNVQHLISKAENNAENIKEVTSDLNTESCNAELFEDSLNLPKEKHKTDRKRSEIVKNLANNFEEQQRLLELEREKLKRDKSELSSTLAFIEKEKINLAAQKLELIKLSLRQDVSKPSVSWNLRTSSSFSVITTKEDDIVVPENTQLAQCSTYPDQEIKNLTSLWSLNLKETRCESNRALPNLKLSSIAEQSEPSTPCLPKWAVARAGLPTIVSPCPSFNESLLDNETPNKYLEEYNLIAFRSAMENIHK